MRAAAWPAMRASTASPTTIAPSSSRNAGSITSSSRPQDHREVFDASVPTTTSVSPGFRSWSGSGAGIGSSPRTTATIETPVLVRAPVSPMVRPANGDLAHRSSRSQPSTRWRRRPRSSTTRGASGLRQRARILLVERDRIARGIRVALGEDHQVDPPALALEHAEPDPGLRHELGRHPQPGSGVSLTVDIATSSQPLPLRSTSCGKAVVSVDPAATAGPPRWRLIYDRWMPHGTPEFLDLHPRSEKPRSSGLTHVLDKGSPRRDQALLARVGGCIDLWKLGWGTAYLEPDVPEKVSVLAHRRASLRGGHVARGGVGAGAEPTRASRGRPTRGSRASRSRTGRSACRCRRSGG